MIIYPDYHIQMQLTLSAHPFQHIKQFENGVLITNPPYGIRLGNRE